MITIFQGFVLICTFYFVSLVVPNVRNALIAHRLGFPTVHVPLLAQEGYVWMIFGPVTRLWFKRRLPTIISDRLALTVYGFEYFERDKPFKNYVAPQVKANPNLRGGGKTYALVTAGQFEITTWDAEIAREMTARPKDFLQHSNASFVLSVFGDNLFTSDGATWSRHRRIVAGAVTERVSPVVWDESVRQTRQMLDMIDRDESQGTYRMFDYVKRIAIHVLYAAGMGNATDFETGEQSRPGMQLTYIDAIRTINDSVAGPLVLPTSLMHYWPSWMPGASYMRHLGQAKVEFPIHTEAALSQERQLAAESGAPRNNVMSALIAASEQDEGSEKKTKGPALTEKELQGNLWIFTAAGFDTTANTITFSLILLARYPRWQKWLLEEIDTLIPNPDIEELDYQEIFPRAHRVMAVMLETLRLYTPLIHILKEAKTEQQMTTSLCGTFRIPAPANIYVNTVLLHRDPDLWRNLNMTKMELSASKDDEDGLAGDEHNFRPTRWLNPPDSESKLFQPPKGAFLPWSAGPRVCPGQKMAQVEYVGVIVALFARRKLEVVRKDMPVKGAKVRKLSGIFCAHTQRASSCSN